MIKNLTYNKSRFLFVFEAPEYFRLANGNSLKDSRGIISNELIKSFADEEIASLRSSKCQGNKHNLQSFVERLIMTDLQLIQLLYQYNDCAAFKIPVDLLDDYMNVVNSVHIKILEKLIKYGYISVTPDTNGQLTVTAHKFTFVNSPAYYTFMVPGNPKINSFIQRMNNCSQESKSLF